MFYIILGTVSAFILILAIVAKFKGFDSEENIQKHEEEVNNFKKALAEAKINAEKQNGVSPVAWIITLLIIGVPIYFIFFTSADTAKEVVTEKTDLSAAAFVVSKNYISQILKSPSTADFPYLDFSSTDLGDNRYLVSSYVDSQNGFGATVRSEWTTTLQFNGGQEADLANWTMEEIIFDGEVVFP